MAKRVTYVLPEAKLLELLHKALFEGYTYAAIDWDQVGVSDPDYDPIEKDAEDWIRNKWQKLRSDLKEYIQSSPPAHTEKPNG